jgi:DNA mismatch repair protein MutL
LVQRALVTAISSVLSGSPWLNTLSEQPARRYVLNSPDPAAENARAERVQEALSRYRPAPARSRLVTDPAETTTVQPDLSATRSPPEPGLPLHDWSWVGTLWNTYLLMAFGDQLVVVDQHAAHERITFERLRQSVDNNQVRSQRLLIPVEVEGQAPDEQQIGRLNDMGFEVQAKGDDRLQVLAVPALLGKAAVAELIRDVLDEMSQQTEGDSWEQRRLDVLGRMACHASVRAGQKLGEEEIRSLLRQLSSIDFASRCPHGRPVLIEMNRAEVAGWFLRT